jgi:phosphatidylserine decarboxylase
MNVAPGGWRYALVPLVGALPAFFISPGVAAALAALGLAALFFHRDPDRSPPLSGVVAPADGKVSVLREEGDRLRVGVFMNVWDVHVNRAPTAGTVEAVDHVDGAHRPAFSKESDRNERVHVRFDDYEVTLVAGAFARRIHPYVETGETLDRGDRIGHISFGSRADVLLPPEFDREHLDVDRGEKVTAGETVLARRGAFERAGDRDETGAQDETAADESGEADHGTGDGGDETTDAHGLVDDRSATTDADGDEGIGMVRDREA